jgi:hypothetical protein
MVISRVSDKVCGYNEAASLMACMAEDLLTSHPSPEI